MVCKSGAVVLHDSSSVTVCIPVFAFRALKPSGDPSLTAYMPGVVGSGRPYRAERSRGVARIVGWVADACRACSCC